ncbi:putative six-bladed beta-propeller, TolB [Helianthus annuus]|uniref:Putative tricorn protease n=1 Tax=Helianthus annuus TaxID=4232 RepID=A0A251T0X1_HELAN|nr:uncharacterized protein LOC110892692 [Helianthus annuus]KAF5777514.1 putative six-bladed beta-propeller, TolB [Helianthus annuus]KAJ0489029.1 putative transcription factor WD40-like family [Helianthus annuus]KAJ0492723.1 putative transcription factor WD40-like family [Helianthus annuus]KAJ0504919.1 putative transcription factor WD40-like family [Helianthus annuus]KAJ0862325.1 putative transcription factor WD40-like family [Helianthus annuus]
MNPPSPPPNLSQSTTTTPHYNPFPTPTPHYKTFVSPNNGYLGYHRFRGEIESSDNECESIVPHLNPVSSPINELRMLRLNSSFPSFSPTGDLIAFNPDFDSKVGLDFVKSDGSKRWSLLKGRTTFYNSWSPTEKNVIFTSIGPIFDPVKVAMQIARVPFNLEQLEDDVIDVKAEIKILTREETGNDVFSSCSTDGKRLVFRSGWPGHKNLYILDVVDGEFKSEGGIWQLTDGEWIDTMSCWSPDGKLITFSSNWHNPANVDAFSIYVRCSNGSDVRRIYVAGDEGSEEVDRWVVRGGGGGLREIRWW